jgi:hypothetical protein|nr:MAG TPA: hypothetical protein [Caudoviricetes sp.]
MKTTTQTYEPLRYKRLPKSKAIIIITECSDEQIERVLKLFDDRQRVLRS